MATSPVISLTYFDIPGPAEAIRLAFYVGDVPFEDRRVSRDDFELLKAGRCQLGVWVGWCVTHCSIC